MKIIKTTFLIIIIFFSAIEVNALNMLGKTMAQVNEAIKNDPSLTHYQYEQAQYNKKANISVRSEKMGALQSFYFTNNIVDEYVIFAPVIFVNTWVEKLNNIAVKDGNYRWKDYLRKCVWELTINDDVMILAARPLL